MKTIKVAVTGGPSGGKTTLIDAIKKELGTQVAVVPESASILYRGGFPRIKNRQGLIHAQKAIYYTGKELEELIEAEFSPAVLVCDRGSIDSLAYWPDSADSFFDSLHTTRAKEYARYDWVVHLDTAGIEQYDGTNPIRTESHSEAQTLNQKILDVWEAHPRRVRINQKTDFLSKMSAAYGVVQAIIDGQTLAQIRTTYE
ncbi:MAG: ATP-binding protein [Bdellovibrionaceae bacterium]|nr:ATP-binding protein [Pseudobdellovibrionaceae bacterium]